MGHLGVTEVLLGLGLVGLIFAETIVRRFTLWVARTPLEANAPALAATREPADLERESTSEPPSDGADDEKARGEQADAGP